MTDEDGKTDNNKQSKRDRLKGALARTKSKFKKDKDTHDTAVSDDVDDFLAAGRSSTSSSAQPRESLSQGSAIASRDEESVSPASTRPSTSDSSAPFPTGGSRSPRKLPIPKIDVSNAQRWPKANPVGTSEQEVNDFLRPQYQGRSQSASSFSNKPKKKGRGRGLSVSFIEAPPVVIGEGGDDAPTPPAEIGKARERARSASPMPYRPPFLEPVLPMNGTYGKRPSPNPLSYPAHSPPDILQPRMVQRIQTGLASASPTGSGLDREFEMTLGLGSASPSPISTIGSSPNTPVIVSPKPMRVVHPPPVVLEEPNEHTIKQQEPSSDSEKPFREGDALRMHLDKQVPTPAEEEIVGWRPPRRDTQESKISIGD
jgi:hypothetical protein